MAHTVDADVRPPARKTRRLKAVAPFREEAVEADVGVMMGKENVGQEAQKKKEGRKGKRKPLRPVAQNGQTVLCKHSDLLFDGADNVRSGRNRRAVKSGRGAISGEEVTSKEDGGDLVTRDDKIELGPKALGNRVREESLIDEKDVSIGSKTPEEGNVHVVSEQHNEVAAPVEQYGKTETLPEHRDITGNPPREEASERDSKQEMLHERQFAHRSGLADDICPLRAGVESIDTSNGSAGEEARVDQVLATEKNRISLRCSLQNSSEVVQQGEVSAQAANATKHLQTNSFPKKPSCDQASEDVSAAELLAAEKHNDGNNQASERKDLSTVSVGNGIKKQPFDEGFTAADAVGNIQEPSKPTVCPSSELEEADEKSSDEETPVVKRRRRNRVVQEIFKIDERVPNDLDQKFKKNDDNRLSSKVHSGLGSRNSTQADDDLDLQLKENSGEVSKPDVRASHGSQTERGDDDGKPHRRAKSAERRRGHSERNITTQNGSAPLTEQSFDSQSGAVLPVANASGRHLYQKSTPCNSALVDSEISSEAQPLKANRGVSANDSKSASQSVLLAPAQGLNDEEFDDDLIESRESERAFSKKSSQDVLHKASTPQQECSHPTQPRRPEQVKGSVSFSLQTSPPISPGKTQDQSNTESECEYPASRPQLVVGKDGMIGEAGIGFLSKLASTPATSSRAKNLTDAAQADSCIHRRIRLFNPTPSIYSATRRALNKPTLRDVGSSKNLSRTPSTIPVNQRLTRNLFPTSAVKNDSKAFSSAPVVATARVSSAGSGTHANIEKERTKSAAVEAAQHEVQHNTIESERKDIQNGDKLMSSRELEHSVRQNDSGESELLKSPYRDVSQTKPLFGKGQSYAYHRTIQPKTAPNNGVRPRTEGKLIKSAFRERIERLHANASLSRSTPEASAVLPGSDANLKSTPGVSSTRGSTNSAAKQEGGTAYSSLSDGNDDPGRPEENGTVQTRHSTEKINGESNATPPGSNDPERHIEKEVSHENAKIADTGLSKIRGDEGSLSATASDSEGVTKTMEILQIERVTPKTPANAVFPESARKPKTVQDKTEEGESIIPVSNSAIQSDNDGNTDNESQGPQKDSARSALNHDEAFLTQSIQGNIQTPSTISNLVSSVTSFLPSASFLLGSHPMSKNDEKAAEEQARLHAKKQREDAERREAELSAKREAQRIARQQEAEEKQRKAENRRRLLAEAEKHREEERRRKEELRTKKRQEEEEKQRVKKEEEDKRREEHRKRVLEQKRQNEKATQRREMEMRRALKEKHQPSKLKSFHPNATLCRHDPSNAVRVGKTKPSSALPPQPPKTPLTQRQPRQKEEPQWELTDERKRGVSESSDEIRERRRRKVIPQWAKTTAVWKTLQNEKGDPDVVFARGAPSCNLESVFTIEEGTTTRKFRPREDSGDWTRDRLTAKEEMEYKRRAGFFDNV